jgi:hypothetical protein
MHKRMPVALAAILACIVMSHPSNAQELDCTVKVNYEGVSTTNKDLLVNFDADVREYMNNYKWGNDDLDEKVKCMVDIFIRNASGDRYSAEVFIGSQRSVFNDGGTKGVLRLKDDAWEFTYVKGRPIVHTPYSFNDLASFLDFYAYLILGYDYDTYEKLAGTQFFQKAADIANLGRATGGKGWQPTKTGYSRIQLIDELLNSKFAPVRVASFKYHFSGLDSLAISRTRALKNIHDAILMIGEVRKNADPRSQIIKAFFDVKFQELAELFVGYDPKVYVDLAAIDVAHQTTYEEYRKKRK